MKPTIDTYGESLKTILSKGLSLGLLILDPDYRVVYYNEWVEKQVKVELKYFLGESIFKCFPEISERGKDRFLIASMDQGLPHFLSSHFHEYFISIDIFKDQMNFKMFQDTKIYPLLEGEGRNRSGVAVVIEDVTERTLYQNEIFRLNRLLSGIGHINKLSGRIEAESDLFEGACKILVEKIGYAFSWIGFIEKGSFVVKPKAYAGIEEEMMGRLITRWDDTEYGTGTVGKAIKTGQTQVIHNIQDEPFPDAWRAHVKKMGYQKACAAPLNMDGKVSGALIVYSTAKNAFYGREAELFEDVAVEICSALSPIRERRKRLRAEAALKARKRELERQSKRLLDVNATLNIMLKRREQDQRLIEERVLFNIRELVEPLVESLKKSGLDKDQKAYADTMELFLKEIVSPFSRDLHAKFLNLTLSEIRVANLIKEGKTTKEIATLLTSTQRAVEFHRQNLRKKLGINNRKVNLATHLFSIIQ